MIGKCTDQSLGQRLHHYELGLLSEEDRREFEIHLLSCDHCIEEVRRFQEVARLMKHEQSVQNVIKEMAGVEDEKALSAAARTSSTVRDWLKQRAWIPATSILVVMLLLLVLKPWGIRIEPTMEAMASKKSIAVMYFENLSDSSDKSRMSDIVANLLITDLSQAYSLDVVSSQRLYDIMNLMGIENQKTISRDVAYEVARKAKADFILVGSILQTTPEIIITAQLVDVESGLVSHSYRATSKGEERVFDAVDKMTADLCSASPLPSKAVDEVGKPVAELTTYSSEAYRHYVAGVDSYNRFYFTEAIKSFEQAVEADSGFAMAYYYLSLLTDNKLISDAVKYSTNVGRMDRVLIQSQNALVTGDRKSAIEVLKNGLELFPQEKSILYKLGQIYYDMSNYKDAATYFERAVEVDPLFESALNLLAYSYDRLGRFNDALMTINQYVSLAPDDPNPYDSRGDIYCSNGFFDRAVESYEMALDHDKSFTISQLKLGDAFFALNEYDSARAFFENIVSGEDPKPKPSARGYLALIPMQHGRLREAIAYLDKAIAADSLEASPLWMYGMSFKYSLKAQAYAGLRQFDKAVAAMSQAIRYQDLHSPYDKSTYRCQYVEYLIASGNLDSARSVTATMEKEDLAGRAACSYHYAKAMLYQEAGDLESALNSLTCDPVNCNTFQFTFAYSKVLMESKRYAEAIQQLSGLVESRCLGESEHGFDVALVRYFLGVAHQELGNNETALSYFNEFLTMTADGDSDIVEIQDAKRRVTSLMTSS